MIEIRWQNKLSCKLDGDRAVLLEIHERYSFFAEGYKFNPRFQSGQWDGKIKMFDLRTFQFPTGLLSDLKSWLSSQGYDFLLDVELQSLNRSDLEFSIIDAILKGTLYDPYDFQLKAACAALRASTGLILSPTGSGKSLIIFIIVRYLLEIQQDKILLLVPNVSLVEQMASDFEEYVTDGWTCSENVYKLYSGIDKLFSQRVLITTRDTARTMPAEWFEQFNAILVDEAHGADSKTVTKIIKNMAHVDYRFGFTGTLRGKMHELEMRARFGAIIPTKTTQELIEMGVLAPLEIDCLVLSYPESDRLNMKKKTYPQQVDFLVRDDRRNRFIAKLATRQKGNVLALFNFVERHGDRLKVFFEDECEKSGKKLFYIHGAVSAEDREKLRKEIEKLDNAVVLASFGTFSTGSNVKSLKTLIFCHPYKAKILTQQSIGRILRKTDADAKLIDIGDDFRYITPRGTKKKTIIFDHFHQRLQLYENEGFKFRLLPMEVT